MYSFDCGRVPPPHCSQHQELGTEPEGQHDSRLAIQPQRQLMPPPMQYPQPHHEFHYSYPPPGSHHFVHNPDFYQGNHHEAVPLEAPGWVAQHHYYGPVDPNSGWRDKSAWEAHQAAGSGYHATPDAMWSSSIRAGEPPAVQGVSGDANNYARRHGQPLQAPSSTMYPTHPSYHVFVPVSHVVPVNGTDEAAAWRVNESHPGINELHSPGYAYRSPANQEFVRPTKPCARRVSGDDEVMQQAQARSPEEAPTSLRVEPLLGTDEKLSMVGDQGLSLQNCFRTLNNVVHPPSSEQEPQRKMPASFRSQSGATVQQTRETQDSRDEEPTARQGQIADGERTVEKECSAATLPSPEASLSSKSLVPKVESQQGQKPSATIGKKCPKKVPAKKKTAAKKKPGSEDDDDDELTPTGRLKRGYPGWRKNYDKLVVYYKENGHCVVPRGYLLDPQLAVWVADQRRQYKKYHAGMQSNISPERIELLNSIDFVWDAQLSAWERQVNALKDFKKRTGHCHVPWRFEEKPVLCVWVRDQRRHYSYLQQGKPTHMTPERVKELEELGFAWDTNDATWFQNYFQLVKYSETHGDCQVPTHYQKDQRLGFWVHQQRREYAKFMEGKPAMITSRRIADLEHIGFTWEFKSMRIRKPYVPVKKRNKEEKRTTTSKNKKPRNEETAQQSDNATTSDDDDESESSDGEEMPHLEV